MTRPFTPTAACGLTTGSSTAAWTSGDWNTESQYSGIRIYSKEQKSVISFFKNYPTSLPTTLLTQSDFSGGTYRIKTPGIYRLSEDIYFNPNPNDDWMPTKAQTEGGADAEYPVAPYGPYHLGFFAAITVECNNVVIDLAGFALSQHRLHYLQQRFYANIELASSPFIPNQGPASFGPIVSANMCLITNGVLGLSSHHGIHGNGMTNILLEGLILSDFEVAGIALNGAVTAILRNITMTGTVADVPVTATYSQCRFIRSSLISIGTAAPDFSITIDGADLTADDLLTAIQTELAETLALYKDGKDVPSDSIFFNEAKLSDGNCYGLLLNPLGVAVNGFRPNRDGATGNTDILAHDLRVENISSAPVEVIGISSTKSLDDVQQGVAYGGAEQVGPVGDVLAIQRCSRDDGSYTGNILSNAQVFIGAYKNAGKPGGGFTGTGNIVPEIVEWVESGTTDIRDIVTNAPGGYYFVNGRDSMGHHMKGNIAVFLSATKDCTIFSSSVLELDNVGDWGSTSYGNVNTGYEGSTSRGAAITGSSNTTVSCTCFRSISSKSGCSYGIDILGQSNDITIYNYDTCMLSSASPVAATELLLTTNQRPVKTPVLISSESTGVSLSMRPATAYLPAQ